MAHQGFRYGRIDGIHRHMVAIVRCPAKCQLGKITSSNDHTAGLVGKIHQNLGSLTRLSVFIRHIMLLRILSDVAEMEIDGLFDINLFLRLHQGTASVHRHSDTCGPSFQSMAWSQKESGFSEGRADRTLLQ